MAKPNMTILIVILVLIIIFAILFYIYKYINKDKISGSKTVEFIKYIHDAKDYKKISSGSIPGSAQGNEYNINFWMYINDYIYRIGSPKHVLSKGEMQDINNANPSVTLLSNTNTLRVQVGLQSALGDGGCAGEVSDPGTLEPDYCDVENIPLQRWLCMNISLSNNVIEIFINGELHKSCNLRGFPRQTDGHLHICNNGGFNGFISNLKYSNKALSVSEIKKIYNSGPMNKQGFFN